MKYKLLVKDPKKLFQIEVNSDENLLSQLLKLGLNVPHSCGGSGTCGTCQFVCQEGLDLIESPNQVEMEFWNERGETNQNKRLSCQCFLKSSNQPSISKTAQSSLKLKINFTYEVNNY